MCVCWSELKAHITHTLNAVGDGPLALSLSLSHRLSYVARYLQAIERSRRVYMCREKKKVERERENKKSRYKITDTIVVSHKGREKEVWISNNVDNAKL